MENFLENINYCNDPFPLLQGSLPIDFYNDIKNSWPTFDHNITKSVRLDYPLEDYFLLEKFSKIISEAYKIFQININGFDKQFSSSQLRVQYSENKPSITTPLDIRGWHLDAGNKHMVGLWYFRDAYDKSRGGDLFLFNPESKNKKKIKYRENFLVLFPNTINAWHSITPRLFGVSARKYINIVIEDKDRKEMMHQYDNRAIKESNIIHNETMDDNEAVIRYNLLKRLK